MDTVQCASSAQAWPHVHQGACAATISVRSGFTHTFTPVQPPCSVLWKVVYPVPTPMLTPWGVGGPPCANPHTQPLVAVGSLLCANSHIHSSGGGRGGESSPVPFCKDEVWKGCRAAQ